MIHSIRNCIRNLSFQTNHSKWWTVFPNDLKTFFWVHFIEGSFEVSPSYKYLIYVFWLKAGKIALYLWQHVVNVFSSKVTLYSKSFTLQILQSTTKSIKIPWNDIQCVFEYISQNNFILLYTIILFKLVFGLFLCVREYIALLHRLLIDPNNVLCRGKPDHQ